MPPQKFRPSPNPLNVKKSRMPRSDKGKKRPHATKKYKNKSKSSSVDLGASIKYSKPNQTVMVAESGFSVQENSISIGEKKDVPDFIKYMYPSHRFMYSTGGLSNITNSGTQSFTQLSIQDVVLLNDSLTKSKDLLNENPNMTLADLTGNATTAVNTNTGNPLIVIPSTVGVSDPSSTSISGYLQRMYVEKIYAKLRIANNCDIGCKVEVVPILVKQSCSSVVPGTTNVAASSSPATYWQQLISQQNLATNLSSPIQPTGFQIDTSTVGLRPYDSRFRKDFEKFYKCLPSMKCILSAGQNTIMHFKNDVFRELKNSDLLDYVNIEGITMYLFVFSEGVLAANKGITSSISTATTGLMFTLEQTVTTRVTQFNKGYTVQVSRLDRGISRFDQTFVDPISGAVDTDGVDLAET